ncbi:hypothetical protein ODJ79_30120 [Actinoplanes sp. KI2]|uniref:hypothetical protein n=1 Tax=Actinoplanes sp. KI2 TaxID=2983315 RepID=UPI0021D5F3FC|nr:hypothetical protein [Actinoplanes sp. KI2]MCU7727995.1 hypothetical protein [Actinoplanes sp. KI2]
MNEALNIGDLFIPAQSGDREDEPNVLDPERILDRLGIGSPPTTGLPDLRESDGDLAGPRRPHLHISILSASGQRQGREQAHQQSSSDRHSTPRIVATAFPGNAATRESTHGRGALTD